MEFDFSQLEVAILAHISKDSQLINDITTGTDIHSALFADMYGKLPTKEERKWFKTLTFGLLYGAGVKTLSKNAACTVDVAEKFVATFYKRYSGVKNYHDNIIHSADIGSAVDPANVYRTYRHLSETGRIYEFKEYENSEWVAKKTRRKYSFSPTELKNYPVQGLATADIVPLMVGLMFRKFKNNSSVALVNTIHDSILLDVKEEVADEVKEQVFELLNNTHVYYEKTFGIPLKLPLSVGCSVGKNWHDMTECKV
jgi:DNA polymerase-1